MFEDTYCIFFANKVTLFNKLNSLFYLRSFFSVVVDEIHNQIRGYKCKINHINHEYPPIRGPHKCFRKELRGDSGDITDIDEN